MNLSGTETILIVEDEPQLREIAVRLLQNQGYTVLEARDGAEAINLLTNNTSIDLLFTDIVLPGNMNGMEISKQALQLQPDIKILFASGYTQDVFSMDHELKEVILLDKPYRSAELIRSVRRLLDENHPTDNPPPKADLLTTS
jgi:CheY-like chemotaxis protein